MTNTIYSMDIFLNKARESAFESLFDLLPINFCWIDKSGRLLGCNKSLLDALYIKSHKDVIGKHSRFVFQGEAWDNTQKVIDTGESIRFEEEHDQPDGSKTYFLSIKSPIKSCADEVIGVVNLAVDITEQKLLEIKLAKAKEDAETANKAKSEFLLNIQHDLRTPFSGILSVAELLKDEEKDECKRDYLRCIEESSSALLKILNEMVEYINIGNDNLSLGEESFNIHYLLNDLKKMMLPAVKSKSLDFDLIIPNIKMPYHLIGHPSKVKRILMNIISNSIKFTEKGFVSLTVIWNPVTDKTGLVQFIIKDSGIGIPEDKLEYVFEQFTRLTPSYTGLYPGSGLGLNIVKKLLEEIGGSYEIESQLSQGTKLTIFVPFELNLS